MNRTKDNTEKDGPVRASELYNIAVSPLVSGIFALDWSEDNHVSLITQCGVHVFEFVPHPMSIHPNIKFWRSFIYPSDFVPVEIYEESINDNIWKMKREDMYALLLQEAATPKINDRTSPIPRIVKLAWSPAELAAPYKCLLAILTSVGSVEILHKLGNGWLSAWNLTKRRRDRVENENINGTLSWHERMKRFVGTAVAWSPRFEDSDGTPRAYLVAAFRSSEITIVCVRRIGSDRSSQVRWEPRTVHDYRSSITAKIDQLLWIVLKPGKKHLLLIGFADGQIHGLKMLEISDGKFVNEKLIRYEDYADRMPVTSFKLAPRLSKKGEERNVILVTKSSFLVVLRLDADGECASMTWQRFDGFSITGLTTIGADKILLTTQDARIYAATVKDGKVSAHERIDHDLKTNKVQYLGVTSSPNSAILLNVTSPDRMFDHLLNREPSTLQIFALKNERWNPWRMITEKLDDNAPLRDYWDCLESMRCALAKSPTPEKELPEIPSDLEGFTIERLRVTMWLALISGIFEKRQILRGADRIVGEISEAQPMIFLIAASRHLARLSTKKRPLDKEEQHCAIFLRMYMEVYLAGENDEDETTGTMTKVSPITRQVVETFFSSSHIDAIVTEACDLCGELLSELPWTVDACPRGHKLSRCSLSLLQITSARYRSCPVCGRLYHPLLDREYPVVRCIYCDLPAIYDTRVRFDDSEEERWRNEWKNLSKRPASLNAQSENSKNAGDTDSPATVAKNKRNDARNPHTFAVIVNRDSHNDPLITETWLEF